MNRTKAVRTFFMIFAAVIMTVIMTGCNNGVPKGFFTDADFPEQRIAQNVVVTAEFAEYDRYAEEIRFTVINNGDELLGAGTHFRMQKMEDGEWRNVSVTGIFYLLAQSFEPGTTSSYCAVLKDHVKYPLPEGRYRIGIGYERHPTERDAIMYGEFTIR